MSFENDKYSVEKDPYEWCLRQSKILKAIDMRNHKLLTQMPGELEHVVKCRCNHNCTLDEIANTLQDKNPEKWWQKCQRRKILVTIVALTDHYANNFPKGKEKVYVIEKVTEEESPTEDSESDSMGDAIREQSDEEQDPREELFVEYQEEAPLKIQEIQLEEELPQDNANKNL
ncbi:hypothetical protein O181_108096 [Austropuccinia psidii MF-1]|uniref:Uncharacterized protein n=1 Tax=Austropuccinia psidii MF-1 TaxID=1389203 RepID=A0A9Q3JU47_9BASI|nr:hypothetical protein [Austropuccinia psidii MF-1]